MSRLAICTIQIMKMYRNLYPYFLFPLSLFYLGIVFCRNLLYKYNFFITHKLPCTVISIGNMTTGGTGKTPMVIYICKMLQNKEFKIGIISRGYGRSTKGPILVSNGKEIISTCDKSGDEPIMMAKKLTNTPIIVDENRYRGGMILVKNFELDIIIMDDGFQHISLYRDLDIVLINGSDNLSDHKLLPHGALREPWHYIKRADVIFITKEDPKPFLIKKIKKTSLPFFKTKIKASIIHMNYKLSNSSNFLDNKKVFLLSGIANPDSFYKVGSEFGCEIIGSKIFKDHFKYSKKHVLDIEFKAEKLGADCIITTEKDWVKVEEYTPKFPFVVIGINFQVINEKRLESLFNF